MKDSQKTKQQPIKELVELRQRIGELETLEAEHKEAEELYTTLTSSSPIVGVYIAQDRKFVFVNPQFMKDVGFTENELLGTDSLMIVHPEDREMVRQNAVEMLKGRRSAPYEYRIVNKAGETRWAMEAVTSIQYQGRRATMGNYIDITKRKEMEERLVRSEKLAVLGQLAGGIGHELRNPLGAIKQAAYFLNMALEETEPEVKETLDILEKEVATSERIISSLLGFARPQPPTRNKVNVNDTVQEALSRVTVPENVRAVKQLGESLPAILADSVQLGQVFTNITLNAIQAMPEGGQLVVKSEAPVPGWVNVSFADTGAGISKENMGKLFEPLFTTKAKGIGLGLAIVQTLVEGHGGTIEAQSKVGKGSTFTIRLPIGTKGEK